MLGAGGPQCNMKAKRNNSDEDDGKKVVQVHALTHTAALNINALELFFTELI